MFPVVTPGALVTSLLLVAMPFAPSSDAQEHLDLGPSD